MLNGVRIQLIVSLHITTLSCLVSILNMLHHVVPAWTRLLSNNNNWLCPPVNLIVQTVRKLQSCNGIGTLIIPEWPSSLFWPYLHCSGLVFKSYVKAVFCLPKLHDLLIEGPGQRAVYKRKKSVFPGCRNFNMLALRLDFRVRVCC